jgi:hemolysin III
MIPVWQPGEKFANSLTHGVAVVVCVIPSFFLIRKVIWSWSRFQIVGMVVFSLSMVELYTASTIYHGLLDCPAKRTMRFIDHCSVFSLIAGSYTPIALTCLRQHGGLFTLAVMWGLFAAGTIGKILFFDVLEPYTAYLYIAMGWLIVVNSRKFFTHIPPRGICWLVAGGISYTGGCYFFVINKPFWHTIFHLFIMMGTFCHILAIGLYAEDRGSIKAD